MKPKSSEPQCRHRADLDMASQCREASWFVFSISFAFHGDNFMLRIPLAILKCLPVGHRALWTPPFPASPEKALPFFLTGSAQVACPGQKSCGRGGWAVPTDTQIVDVTPGATQNPPLETGDSRSTEVSLQPPLEQLSYGHVVSDLYPRSQWPSLPVPWGNLPLLDSRMWAGDAC